MTWYYANAGQSTGPISQTDFDALVQNGTIRAETLVWREGMANWMAYGALASAPAAAEAVPAPGLPPQAAAGTAPAGDSAGNAGGAGGVVCSECGGAFRPDEVVRYGTVMVCGSCKPIFLQKLREGVRPAAGLAYAGFWIRFAATFIDGILLGIVNMILVAVVARVLGTPMEQPDPNNMGPFIVMQLFFALIQFVVGVAYDVWMTGRYGATLGKMACRIRVVTATGEPISYLRAFGRYFAKILSGIILGIGYLMAAFDDEKRALHDRICETRVVTGQ